MNDILAENNVSRETIEKLKNFQKMVIDWNDKFNLVSQSSINDLWNRHILDSLQLINLLKKEDKTLYDFGSGAGFPGIVLAIASQENFPELKITLIESITKKATFLQEVKRELKIDVDIKNERIEKIKSAKVDIITSRAMASLDKLLEYAEPFCLNTTRMIFPKGKSWKEEIEKAKENWFFQYDAIQSQTNAESYILYIKKIRRKKQNG